MPIYRFFKTNGAISSSFCNRRRNPVAGNIYLLAKYYLKKKGCNPEIELQGLSEIYENIGLVNVAIIKRLQAATEKDSTLNTLVLLDVFATSLSLEVEEFWAENENIFMPFLKSCIGKEKKKN
jgi:hypothetical protein